MVVHAGYYAAFLVLGAVAAVGFALFLIAMRETAGGQSQLDDSVTDGYGHESVVPVFQPAAE
jgi:hypothetical protein